MLTQTEADSLIAMKKYFQDQTQIAMPPGTDKTYELIGEDKREQFLLDLWRGMIRLSKIKLQTRARKMVVLVRLDIDGAPHSNPDGTKMGGTHIHLYREGYDDRWAYPLDPNAFSDPRTLSTTFQEFCRYCHIERVPNFQAVIV